MYTHRKGGGVGTHRYPQRKGEAGIHTRGKDRHRYTHRKGAGTHRGTVRYVSHRLQTGSLGIHTPRGQVQLTQGVSTQCTPGQPSALDDPEKYHHSFTESFPPLTPNTANIYEY